MSTIFRSVGLGWYNICKEKVCHFIATQWDVHYVSFTLYYAMFFFSRFNLQMANSCRFLVTFNKTEEISSSVLVARHFELHMHLKFASTVYREYMSFKVP